MGSRSLSGHQTVASGDSGRAIERGTHEPIGRESFDSLVHGAVEHLYDRASLQGHPLGELVCPGAGDPASNELERLLIDTIEQLKPGSAPSRASPEWRRYFYAHKRYVEGAGLDRILDELAIGERQARRYNHEALRYICGVLWSRYNQERLREDLPDPTSRSTDEDEVLAAEVASLAGFAATEPTPFSETLDGVLMTVDRLLETQRITLDVSLPADLPPVAVPRVILRQILLGTLAHFGEQRAGALIELSASQGHDAVEVWITARPGRSRRPRRAIPEGFPPARLSTGMTFDTIKRLVELQNGTVDLQESEGGAVRMRLALPASPLVMVLVIDDNLDFRRLFQRFLEGSRYRARYAEVTDDFAQLAREVRPDLIILDVMMPMLDGWEILEQLKNQPETREIPVIVCSVLHEPALARALGASDVLAKPITRQDLRAALDRHH